MRRCAVTATCAHCHELIDLVKEGRNIHDKEFYHFLCLIIHMMREHPWEPTTREKEWKP
jgi:hypothetical protein